MESKPGKVASKKHSSAAERTSHHSKKSNQGIKKRKKNKKKTDSKDFGKTSTSPDGEFSDNNLESDSSAVNQLVSKVSDDFSHLSVEKTSNGSSTTTAKGLSDCLQTSSEKYTVHYTSLVAISGNNSRNNSKCVKPVESFLQRRLAPSTTRTSNSISRSKQNDKNYMPPILNHESMRWENELSDADAEEERIKAYKLNRRKRYITNSNQTYSEWISKHNAASSGEHGQNKQSPGSRSPRARSSDINHSQSGSLPQDMSGFSGITLKSHGHEIMLNC